MRVVNNLTWLVLDRTVAKLRQAGVSASEAPALREPKRVWSYGRLLTEVGRAGNALRSLGLVPGERVALWMHDGVELAAAFLGAARVGLCPVPLDTTLRPEELGQALRAAGAAAVVTHGDLADTLALVARRVPTLRRLLCLGGGLVALGPQSDFGALCADADPRCEPVALPLDRDLGEIPAFLLFETGPDGRQHGRAFPVVATQLAFETLMASTLAPLPEDRVFCTGRLSTVTGLGLGLLYPLLCGAVTFLLPGPVRPRSVFDVLGSFKPTLFSGTPLLYHELLQDYLEQSAPRPRYFQSVRLALCGSEPMPPPVERRLRAIFQISTVPCFCLGEALPAALGGELGPGQPLGPHLAQVTNPPIAPGESEPSSLTPEQGAHWGKGVRPLPGLEARLCDDAGRRVSDGEVGRLRLRGAPLLGWLWPTEAEPSDGSQTGRFEIPQSYVDEEGWTVTPERFFRDAEGGYYHVGRADGLLRIGGRLVAPRQVESALLGHPAVWECAVGEDTTEDGLAQVKAYVVLNVGREPGVKLARELMEFARQQLAPHKAPQAVEFLPSLPRGTDGRVARWRLRTPKSQMTDPPSARSPSGQFIPPRPGKGS